MPGKNCFHCTIVFHTEWCKNLPCDAIPVSQIQPLPCARSALLQECTRATGVPLQSSWAATPTQSAPGQHTLAAAVSQRMHTSYLPLYHSACTAIVSIHTNLPSLLSTCNCAVIMAINCCSINCNYHLFALSAAACCNMFAFAAVDTVA